MANNLSVWDAAGAVVAVKTTESGGVHTPQQRIDGYDSQDDMLKVKSVQKKFRDSFSGASVDATKWESVIGTGGAITVSGGNLTIGSGTTINAQTYIQSVETFTIPFRISIGLSLSQRIANQSFIVEAVSVDKTTGIPDGLFAAAILFDGTTATQAKYRVQTGGNAALDSSASTFPTSAGSGLYEIEPFADECWFHGSTVDSTSSRTNSYRRHQQIPDPNALYKIRLRWLNGGTAPASNTNAVVNFIAVQDYAELTAEITAGRGQAVAGQGIGVVVTSVPTTGVNLVGSMSQGASTHHNLISAATTNATSVKTSVGTINDLVLSNNGAAARYFKLYNKASAPTVGTDTPIRTVMIPAGGTVVMDCGVFGLRCSTGIAYALTAGIAVADTTAVAAAEVVVNMSYF